MLASGMKKVFAASGDYFVYFHPLTIVSNIFMRNKTYPIMFIGREITSSKKKKKKKKPFFFFFFFFFFLHNQV